MEPLPTTPSSLQNIILEPVCADLPSHIIFEILTYTSIETLSRCRCVSMEWNRLTYQSRFVNLHGKRSKTIYGYVTQPTGITSKKHTAQFVSGEMNRNLNSELSLDFLPMESTTRVTVMASAKGILLCDIGEGMGSVPEYLVCKPSTQQWRRIPIPENSYHWITREKLMTHGLTVIKSSHTHLHFKLVRFSYRKYVPSTGVFTVGCEFFDSNTWEWKSLEEIMLSQTRTINGVQRAFGHSLYWLSRRKDEIFAFDAIEETLKIFKLPEQMLKRDNPSVQVKQKLTEYEGRLGIVCLTREHHHEKILGLWVLADSEKMVWKRKIMGTQDWTCKEKDGWWIEFVGFYDSDVAVFTSICRTPCVLFFNVKKGLVEHTGRIAYSCRENRFLHFQSDFEPKDELCEFGRESID